MGRTEVLLGCQAQLLLDAPSQGPGTRSHTTSVLYTPECRQGWFISPHVAEVRWSPPRPKKLFSPSSLRSCGCSDTIAGALPSTTPHTPAFQHCYPTQLLSPNHQPYLPLQPQPAMQLAQVFILVSSPQKQLFLCILPRSSHHPLFPFFMCLEFVWVHCPLAS